MKPRTKARSIALQVLFEIDLVDHPLGTALKHRLEDALLDERLAEFVTKIVHGVWPIYDQLDKFIADHAPEWPLEQVATIDRNILRIALWEFAVNGETPLLETFGRWDESQQDFNAAVLAELCREGGRENGEIGMTGDNAIDEEVFIPYIGNDEGPR